jgi:hypothetical protein
MLGLDHSHLSLITRGGVKIITLEAIQFKSGLRLDHISHLWHQHKTRNNSN